ncbi:MAG: acyl-CoA desaturase [Bacteroidota bacterium]
MSHSTIKAQGEPTKTRFAQGNKSDFLKTLRAKIRLYFEQTGNTRYGNPKIYRKAILLALLFLTAYTICLADLWTGLGALIPVALVGLSMTAFLFNVAHDASHGAFSNNSQINRIMSYSWDFFGMSSYVWSLKHNLSHHSRTNVHGSDMDIEQGILLRLDPHTEKRWYHRWQHLYAPILYAHFGFFAILLRDFQMMGVEQFGNKSITKHPRSAWWSLILGKLWFVLWFAVLPHLLIDRPWTEIALGQYVCLAIAGIYAVMTLVVPHINRGNSFPMPSEKGVIEGSWAEHQVEATLDFAVDSRLAQWLTGGLNTHVCHHVFPNICHVHYRHLTRLIRETALEYGLNYRSYRFGEIIKSHFLFLRDLGGAKH